ncbi:hypothetical protein AEA09_10635 [Lysinibacillus contaminans]|uniref:DUF91 domain-containing protein n=1 Tax=Lysinibacillus contaminans TaxID=1293441 RepID=A0ABR5K1Z6_9BACI|nr:hypothetical protein [Lysinibacillus contaminans]KOS68957.1 hypothetical protein AEA09_10635 [Lysinibacillus contaminans]
MLFKLNLNKLDYEKVKRVSLQSIGWTEKNLESLVSKHIQDFISSKDLMTIFNERSRQEEPDILALDKNGDLYIFELKRWASNQENLLQVLRYGQLFGNSSYDELNEKYSKYSKSNLSLLDAHKEYFNKENANQLSPEQFNNKQHFIVMTNGLDQQTVEAIIYWKKNGLNIDAIVYWVFEIEGEHYLEFNMYSPLESYLEYESNAYVLNTNHSNNSYTTGEMLGEKKAAAYHAGWQEKIEKIQKDDIVFLYKSGYGIVGFGKGTGVYYKKDYDNTVNAETYTPLKDFYQLKKPLSASKMKEICKQGFNFRQTMFSISEENANKLIDTIQKEYL